MLLYSFFSANGKIGVVLVCACLILTGLFGYLFYLDRLLKKQRKKRLKKKA